MQWLMHVTDEMGYPCPGDSPLWQRSAAISQYSTLGQEGFNGAYAIRAVLGPIITGSEGQIDIMALLISR